MTHDESRSAGPDRSATTDRGRTAPPAPGCCETPASCGGWRSRPAPRVSHAARHPRPRAGRRFPAWRYRVPARVRPATPRILRAPGSARVPRGPPPSPTARPPATPAPDGATAPAPASAGRRAWTRPARESRPPPRGQARQRSRAPPDSSASAQDSPAWSAGYAVGPPAAAASAQRQCRRSGPRSAPPARPLRPGRAGCGRYPPSAPSRARHKACATPPGAPPIRKATAETPPASCRPPWAQSAASPDHPTAPALLPDAGAAPSPAQ